MAAGDVSNGIGHGQHRHPKAKETPANPMPSSGYAAASTALPQPPKTSQNVPKNSAMTRFEMGIRPPLSQIEYELGKF